MPLAWSPGVSRGQWVNPYRVRRKSQRSFSVSLVFQLEYSDATYRPCQEKYRSCPSIVDSIITAAPLTISAKSSSKSALKALCAVGSCAAIVLNNYLADTARHKQTIFLCTIGHLLQIPTAQKMEIEASLVECLYLYVSLMT